MEIGQRVRLVRERLSLTQQELAQEVGVSSQHISGIEVGQHTPSLDLVVRLAGRLGVTTDYLLTGHDQIELDAVGAIRAERRLPAPVKRHLVGLVQAFFNSRPPE